MAAFARGRFHSSELISLLCKCKFHSESRLNSSALVLSKGSNNRIFQGKYKFSGRWQQVAYYYVKKKEKKGQSTSLAWAALGGVACGLIIGAVGILGQPDPEKEDDDLYRHENIVLAHIYRFRDRLHEYREMFVEPSSDLLLPDPLPEPYIQPPYTLVIEMTDVLVHPEYDRSSGWRFRKRPGIEKFLSSLTAPLFEIVIYTHENGFSAAPVVDGLDPEGYIMYRLFRDATKYMNGTHVKDLARLNRDIRKVILIDCQRDTSVLQPRNSFVLPKWEGDPKDIALMELIPFFQTIAMSGIDDVRPVLDFYRNEEDPVAAFRRNQELLRQQQEEQLRQMQEQQKKSSFFGRGLFGRR